MSRGLRPSARMRAIRSPTGTLGAALRDAGETAAGAGAALPGSPGLGGRAFGRLSAALCPGGAGRGLLGPGIRGPGRRSRTRGRRSVQRLQAGSWSWGAGRAAGVAGAGGVGGGVGREDPRAAASSRRTGRAPGPAPRETGPGVSGFGAGEPRVPSLARPGGCLGAGRLGARARWPVGRAAGRSAFGGRRRGLGRPAPGRSVAWRAPLAQAPGRPRWERAAWPGANRPPSRRARPWPAPAVELRP